VTLAEIILSGCLLTSLLLLGVSIFFNIKHGKLILKMIDSIEVSLDILDTRYESISEILEIPLFYDSPQIRQVQKDIVACRDTILTAANILSNVEIELDDIIEVDANEEE